MSACDAVAFVLALTHVDAFAFACVFAFGLLFGLLLRSGR